MIVVLKSAFKSVFISIFQQLYRLAGLQAYSSSVYRKTMPPNPKHYTKEFRLPPIYVSHCLCYKRLSQCSFVVFEINMRRTVATRQTSFALAPVGSKTGL